MSRSPQAARPKRARTPVLVIVILVLRLAVFASVIGLAVELMRAGEDLPTVSSSLAALVTVAAAVSTALTVGVAGRR
ncbi:MULTISPECIES: hypothetical protein [unclassified Kribbella]|uniref:hypothetical protein n=1 Tax=unclassified Kribbella TaxID=2644121 RepID=UPI003017E78C